MFMVTFNISSAVHLLPASNGVLHRIQDQQRTAMLLVFSWCALLFLLQQFFAQIYGEAKNSKASPGHVAIAQLHELGKLQRHYTLNIDGLAEVGPAASVSAAAQRD
jgi:hypothetical protein